MKVSDTKSLVIALWMVFVLMGVFVLLGFFFQFYIDIILVCILIFMGLTGILYETHQRAVHREYTAVKNAVQNLYQWVQLSHGFAKHMKSSHEQRFYRFDRKISKLQSVTEDMKNDLGRKIIDLENRINKAVKTFERDLDTLERIERIAKRLSEERELFQKNVLALSSRQIEALRLAKEGMSLKEYRNRFHIPLNQAKLELDSLVERGLLKKQGRGPGTKYVWNF